MNQYFNRLSGSVADRVGRQSGNFLGICLAVVSTVLLMTNGVIGKKLGASMHPFETTFLRAVIMAIILFPILAKLKGLSNIKPSRHIVQMANGFLFTLALLGWFWALPRVPLDLVASVGFTSQLYAVLGAILLFGEKAHARRWIALGVGFIGAMIIIRPGYAPITPGVIALIFVAMCFASTRLIGKTIATRDNPETLVIWQAVWVSIFSCPLALYYWEWPNGEQLLWLVLISITTILNHYSSAWALRIADIGAIEPVAFLRLLWAALFGFVFFGDIPNEFVIIGGLVVASSVIYIARRERKAGKVLTVPTEE